LFVLIVGGLAWLVQYLPNWRKKPPTAAALERQLVFLETQAKWDPADPDYYMEFEREQPGHYDFAFENPTQVPAELGLIKPSCDCASVQVALLSDSEWSTWQEIQRKRRPAELPEDAATRDFSWQGLQSNDKVGVVAPGGSRGLVRVTWKSRKSEGQSLRLSVDLWAQPQGQFRQRKGLRLETRSKLVGPALFTSPSLPVGALAPGGIAKKDIFFWSATRKKLKFEILNNNPLIVWQVVPLDVDECLALQRALRTKQDDQEADPSTQRERSRFGILPGYSYDTRVRCAFHVTVNVYEQKDGRQLDQGPFHETLSLRVDDQLLGGAPGVFGRVHGEVEIRGADSQGQVDLGSFSEKAGVKRSIFLWTEPKTTLSVATHHPGLRVGLAENAKDSTPFKKSWQLKIEILPGTQTGPLPNDSAVVLRTHSTPPRQIRIPVLGTAVQG
jgi:hypothetical protein